MYAAPIQKLIDSFSRLPGVGARTAERYVFYLLKSGKKDAGELTLALKQLTELVKSCSICWNFSDISPCLICLDKKRIDTGIICVVSEPQHLETIERTGIYFGRYHILRGLLKPDDSSFEYLKIPELLKRAAETETKEIILALNPDLPGETTALFLEKNLKAANPNLVISRLARGLPMNSDLLYADDITLSSAITHRQNS